MKAFLFKFLSFVSIFLAIIITGVYLPPTPRAATSHLFAQLDKDRLLAESPSPRIVLIGGSNISMSLNSQILRDSLNYQPVNMGLSASIGLLYMLDHALPYIGPNDVVIVCPEYSQFYDNLYLGTEDLCRVVLDASPRQLLKLRGHQLVRALKYIPRYALAKYKLSEYLPSQNHEEEVYLRKSFNKYGDMVKHWTMKPGNVQPLVPTPGASFSPEAVAHLVEFGRLLEKRGASLFVTFPAFQRQSFINHEAEIRFIEEQYRLSRFNLLGSADKYLVPDSLLFDTPYHLTEEGVNYRTNLLIRDFRSASIANLLRIAMMDKNGKKP